MKTLVFFCANESPTSETVEPTAKVPTSDLAATFASTATLEPSATLVVTETATLELSQTPTGTVVAIFDFSWSPNSRQIAFVDHGVEVMDLDGRERRSIAKSFDGGIFPPAWSPNGRYLAFSLAAPPRYKVQVVDFEGGAGKILTDDPGRSDVGPMWLKAHSTQERKIT